MRPKVVVYSELGRNAIKPLDESHWQSEPGPLIPRKDMQIGMLRNIYRQAGWEWR
jgi:hypothetical protein